MGRGAALQSGAKEADQIPGDRAIAAVLFGLPVTFGLHLLLPGVYQVGSLPVAVSQRGPGASDGRRGQAKCGQGGNDGAPALQKATAAKHPEQVKQAQIGTDRQRRHQGRQELGHAIDYGWHRVGLRLFGSFRIPCLMPLRLPSVSGN